MTTHVPRFVFGPLGVETSRIGLGCGTLVGRHGFRAAARLVEAALNLGIRYFDVAPLYGMGTAEEVLGEVVGGARDVLIATKAGISRPRYSPVKAMMRRLAKPALDRSRALREAARSMYRRAERAPDPSDRKPHDFSLGTVRRELDESLRLLKRPRVDVYLAHEPGPGDLDAAAAFAFQTLVDERTIGCFGAAITAVSEPWLPFGRVWQSGWMAHAPRMADGGPTHIFHGIVRNADKDRWGRAIVPPSTLLRIAMTEAPESLFLVAASTPEKLRRLVAEVVA